MELFPIGLSVVGKMAGNEELEQWDFKDIVVFLFNGEWHVIELKGFQVFGINDHRDLSKFIKLVYGE